MATSKVRNFGCRINAFESEIIKEILKECEGECIVLNTCTVTSESHRQCLQAARKERRENPGAKIIITGCAATVAPEDFDGIADVIVDNDNKLLPCEYIPGTENKRVLIAGFEGKCRTFLPVQEGCDFRCTYCIVPKARGASRSIPYKHTHEQISKMLAGGVKEIVLTGINLSAYEGGVAALVRRIFSDFSDIRLRLSSLDPGMIDEDLIEVFKDLRLMPHIHLSIQSGDNLILKRMGRRHTFEMVLETIIKLRKSRPGLVIGADFIAGFPTEKEEHFNNTCELIQRGDIQLLHVFPYSERPDTPAAFMPGVEKRIRKERAIYLRELGRSKLKKLLNEKKGELLNVLLETDYKGHSDEFLEVNVIGAEGKAGEIVQVRITDIKSEELWGELV